MTALDTPGFDCMKQIGKAGRRGQRSQTTIIEKDNRTVKADADIARLHYSNKRALPWNKFSERLSNAFKIVDKDPARKYTAERKRDILLDKIRIDHKELAAAKLFVAELPRDPEDTLFERCVNKFGTYVSRAFQHMQADEHNVKRRKISAANAARGDGRGRSFRGNYIKRGGRFGRGSDGRAKRSDVSGSHVGAKVNFNGVDCSDVERNYSASEWQQIGPVGRK